MKNFLLSVLVIFVLSIFGTCFILAGQTLLTLYTAKNISARVVTGCYIHGRTLTCKY